jgi:hypothetical protein
MNKLIIPVFLFITGGLMMAETYKKSSSSRDKSRVVQRPAAKQVIDTISRQYKNEPDSTSN